MEIKLCQITGQEKAHAASLFWLLERGEVEIQASFSAGFIGKTAENLKATAGGEHHEWPDPQIYPTFASIDREEGLSA